MDQDKIKLNVVQWTALSELSKDPGSSWVEPATKSKLRKLGLIGKVVGRDVSGRQKTLSPLTDAGKGLLAKHLESAS